MRVKKSFEWDKKLGDMIMLPLAEEDTRGGARLISIYWSQPSLSLRRAAA